MTTPDPTAPGAARGDEQLTQRIQQLEMDLLFLTGEVTRALHHTEIAKGDLDQLETMVTDLDERGLDLADSLQNALRQGTMLLDTDPARPPAPPEPPPPVPADPAGTAPSRPSLTDLYTWVDTHIAPLVRRTTTTGEGGGIRWCRSWWRHYDAVERFTALFLVFSELSEQDTESWLSAYLRDHLDPHLATLTSPFGPFHGCTPTKHSEIVGPLGHAEPDQASDADAPLQPIPHQNLNDSDTVAQGTAHEERTP